LGNSRQELKHVRVAGKGDLVSIAELHLNTIRYIASLVPPEFERTIQTPPPTDKTVSEFETALLDESSIMLVCEVDARFAGFVLGKIETHGDDLLESPFLTIVYLEIHPEFRRQSVGLSLMLEVEKWARENNLKTLELTVYVANSPAIELYESMNYERLELRMAKRLA